MNDRLNVAAQVTTGISCESCHLGGRAHADGGAIHFVPQGVAARAGVAVPAEPFAAERKDARVVNAISPKNAPECSSPSVVLSRLTLALPCASQYSASAGAPACTIVAPAGNACAVITPINARAFVGDSADNSGAGGTCST